MPVTTEGLVWDSLQKMVHNPGGHWNPGWGGRSKDQADPMLIPRKLAGSVVLVLRTLYDLPVVCVRGTQRRYRRNSMFDNLTCVKP